MSKDKYPRKPGSNVTVHEKNWNQAAAFGHCPACGSFGIEEYHCTGDKVILFFCSDETCQTIMGKRSPARTRWNQDKPQDIIEKEAGGWTWNNDHFRDQNESFFIYTYYD